METSWQEGLDLVCCGETENKIQTHGPHKQILFRSAILFFFFFFTFPRHTPPLPYTPSSMSQVQPRQDPPKGTEDQLEFEELGLFTDAPPVPSLCGLPLKYIS